MRDITIAFDVYGTLIDTGGIVASLRPMLGDQANAVARVWREKQLEYSFRRGLMRRYVDFSVCTRQALDYACQATGTTLSPAQQEQLLDAYRVLPAFADVGAGLTRLQAHGFRLYAFSNGSRAAIDELLTNAGLRALFLDTVSVETVGSFKPDPAVYAHFLRQSGARDGAAWLVSSNPFDVIGALSAGMRAAWLRRTPEAMFDPWELQPTLIASGFDALVDQLTDSHDGDRSH